MPSAPRLERQRRLRWQRHPERLARWDLVEADRRQPDPSDDHRRLAGLVGEELEHRIGRPDQLLGGHVRAARDDQARREAVAGVVAIDEPERGQRPQVAIHRRDRRVEEGRELVGPDLAAVGDRQEEPQAAGERGVLGRLLGRSVASGRARARRPVAVPGHHSPCAQPVAARGRPPVLIDADLAIVASRNDRRTDPRANPTSTPGRSRGRRKRRTPPAVPAGFGSSMPEWPRAGRCPSATGWRLRGCPCGRPGSRRRAWSALRS